MLKCMPTRPGVVPLESFVDVRGPAYIVSRWIAVASEDIDESSANTLHMDRRGMFGANGGCSEMSGGRLEATPKYADCELFDGVRVRGKSSPTPLASRATSTQPSHSESLVRRSAFAAAPLRRDRLRLMAPRFVFVARCRRAT